MKYRLIPIVTALVIAQPPEYYREQECHTYLLVHVTDAFGLVPDLSCVKLDVWEDGYDPDTSVMPLGGCIWIDQDPYWWNELYNWMDTDYSPLEIDFNYKGEEFITILDVTAYVNDPQVTSMKVRVTDYALNWKRSDNVLENKVPGYVVMDLMFRDTEMYHTQPCYQFYTPDDRRVNCDGYLAYRPNGECFLDVVAVVSSIDPPPYIPVTVSAPPEHDPSQNSIEVYLYRLTHDFPSWCNIWNDCYCENITDDVCVEIYCRDGEGRDFVCCSSGCDPHEFPCGAPHDPPAIVASDENHPDPPNGSPVDWHDIPYLLVSSADEDANEGVDIKDYGIALGSGHKFGDDPALQDCDNYVWFWYGMLCSVCDGVGSCSLLNECDVQNRVIESFKKNTLSFGFTWLKAELDNSEAYYPLQCEVDAYFIQAHGYINNQHKSYIKWFPESEDETLFSGDSNDPDQTQATIIMAEDWESKIGRDSNWLILNACWILGDLQSTAFQIPQAPYPQPPGPCDVWDDWQDLTKGDDPPLDAVLGWRWWHRFAKKENGLQIYESSSSAFFTRFSSLLNSENYPGVPDRWEGGVVADDYAVRCYMEAAWEFFHNWGESGSFDYGDIVDPWGKKDKYFKRYILAVSAVDAEHRYVIDTIADPSKPKADWPFKIKTI